MSRRMIHQWKDWQLDYVCDDRYELLHKLTLSIESIVAKNHMDAENQCRKFMAHLKEQEA